MKPLTTTSWILFSDGERFGLISDLKDKISLISKLPQKEFKDLAELKKVLGNLHVDNTVKVKAETTQNDINGFPVKHPEYFNIILEPLPTYTKTETSHLRYAAGYYALKFSYAWTPSFCPKKETLDEYEYLGPYTTKFELQHQISTKNKEIAV